MRTAATRALPLLLALVILTGCAQDPPTVTTGGIEAVGLEVREEIRSVYQIKTDAKKNNLAAGLHYVRKLLDTYNAAGIQDEAANVHAVFHGDAGHFLLKDEVYADEADRPRNPNKAIVADLIRRGVSIELCAQTMRSNGWEPEDVLPGVTIVLGAYPRVIDLQLRGFAYIRF
jgi:intracellular sulfur oxidation DsrE/DsrF family protein